MLKRECSATSTLGARAQIVMFQHQGEYGFELIGLCCPLMMLTVSSNRKLCFNTCHNGFSAGWEVVVCCEVSCS